MAKVLTVQVSDAPYQKLSRERKKRWKAIVKAFDNGYFEPYIIFLAEVLSVLSGAEAEFSGSHSNQGCGTVEEYWSLKAGDLEIFRGKKSELSESWQRVEVEDNRTTISGFPPGRALKWDGEYDITFGMKLQLTGVTSGEAKQLRKIADELFKRVEFSP
ncbi:MAG: hypothetical protein ACD_39C01300G0005 [uncultured bacterium]|nr:MAG: hypothetical protein ACD_39C01300G0005 [uncultured bacterium]